VEYLRPPSSQRHRLHSQRPARLAAELGCDGVHIGQEDASYTEARRLLPKGIVGVNLFMTAAPGDGSG